MPSPAFPFRKSIATVSLSGTLPEKLEAAAAAGFDGVELFEHDLLTFDGTPQTSAASCATWGWRSPSSSPSGISKACPTRCASAPWPAPSASST